MKHALFTMKTKKTTTAAPVKSFTERMASPAPEKLSDLTEVVVHTNDLRALVYPCTYVRQFDGNGVLKKDPISGAEILKLRYQVEILIKDQNTPGKIDSFFLTYELVQRLAKITKERSEVEFLMPDYED